MIAKLDLMKRTQVFSVLSEESLTFLLDYARSVEVPAKEFFFREGDQASSMFILETGSASVIKNWQERVMELRILHPGECFGEMALMDMFPRSASVRAEEDCTALELSPRGLVRLYDRDVEQFTLVQMNLGREVCRRLRAADERLFRAGMGEHEVDTDTVFRAT
ncbi:MAG TPA: cyclic nucleotide-binding domain-containing protein [Thermoanaerobaculia bacterium]|nr:cyclic nucleotide-binding domain-containing protein [Thermoanaerobaculia bacterium]